MYLSTEKLNIFRHERIRENKNINDKHMTMCQYLKIYVKVSTNQEANQ